jgi:hypothetical protein
MKSSTPMATRLALLAFFAMFSSGAIAQQTVPEAQAPAASGSPADPTAPTTALSQPAGTMSKGELKDQRKQQKRDEAAARANAKAAKAQASLVHADAKSKDANDKALQAQEKAGQVTQDPPASTPPPAATAPETTAPPQ